MTVYTTFAGLALAAFASASKTLSSVVSMYTGPAVCIHLIVAVIMLAVQVPLSAELTRLADNDANNIDDAEARLVSAGLTYGSITMLFSVFLVYTPEDKREVPDTAGGFNFRGKRRGFSLGSVRKFLAQFLTPSAKKWCMGVYLIVFLLQGLSAWSLQKAVKIYYRSIQARHPMSDDDIVLLRISVVAFYIVICQVFLIAFFTPMLADLPENEQFFIQKAFTALLALNSGYRPVEDEETSEQNSDEKALFLRKVKEAVSEIESAQRDSFDMLSKLRKLFARVIIVEGSGSGIGSGSGSGGSSASAASAAPTASTTTCSAAFAATSSAASASALRASASAPVAVSEVPASTQPSKGCRGGCNRWKLTPKRYVGVYLISLCFCSFGCSVYILWEAGVQVGLLGDLEAILWALLVLAMVVGLLMASVQWVWHACFTIALFNVILFTYLSTLPFCSDDALPTALKPTLCSRGACWHCTPSSLVQYCRCC